MLHRQRRQDVQKKAATSRGSNVAARQSVSQRDCHPLRGILGSDRSDVKKYKGSPLDRPRMVERAEVARENAASPLHISEAVSP